MSKSYIIVPQSHHRLGKVIKPRCLVWHYTAMLPHTELSLAKVWSNTAGKGNGAHAIIRRNGQVICLAPFDRNSNHAGGPTSGKVLLKWSKTGYNPNSISIGIEVSNPGRVRKMKGGKWCLAFTGTDVVPLPPDIEVETDEQIGGHRDDWGWCKYTDAQVESARKIARIAWECGVTNTTCTVVRQTVAGVKYRDLHTTTMCLRHSDIDPSRKSDPGPLWNPQSLMQPEYTKEYNVSFK